MAKETHQLNNTTDYQFKQAFKALGWIPSSLVNASLSLEDVMGWIDDESPVVLPFRMRSVRVVPTRFAVLGEALEPRTRASSRLADFMEETPKSTLLFSDALKPGAAGLFFARYMKPGNDTQEIISEWYEKMTVPRFIVGQCADKPLLLAPAGAFTYYAETE